MVSEARRIAEEKTRLLRSIAAEHQSKKPVTNPSSDVLERLERSVIDTTEFCPSRVYRNPDGPAAAALIRELRATIERLSAELERKTTALERIKATDTKTVSTPHLDYANDREVWTSREVEGPCAKIARASLTLPPTNNERE